MSQRSRLRMDFKSLMSQRMDAEELSESRYNFMIGLMLVWGFGLNYVIAKLFTPVILTFLFSSSGMIAFLIAYFILVIAGSSLVRSYSAGKCFLGYNMIVLPLSVVVALATVLYEPALVTRAALCTAIVTLIMLIVATAFPQFFQNMAGGLSVALLGVILVEGLGGLFFRNVFTMTDWLVVGIMSLYIGFDWVRANSVQPTTTNAIAAASALYLDIINIFVRLLSILERSRRD